MNRSLNTEPILLTGASGYVGGQLLARLSDQGHRIRCMTRNPDKLRHLESNQIEIVYGDAMNTDSLREALSGCRVAYYLIHSMQSGPGFEEREMECANNFGLMARQSGLDRIIYLGGLGHDEEKLSPHLRSRQHVGDTLHVDGIRVIEFRASIILGAGSLSFEMIRALVERLPLMITPRWVSVHAQPIAINQVIDYLVEALSVQMNIEHAIIEIGGADVVSYGDLMRAYAGIRQLRRLIIPVPVLTPRLSSLWLGLITPLLAPVGKILIESIRHSSVVRDQSHQEKFNIIPNSANDAMRQALESEDREFDRRRWSRVFSSPVARTKVGGNRIGPRIFDSRAITVRTHKAKAFHPIQVIGGTNGWYFGDWLWTVRGWIDRLYGGPGMRRGRRDPIDIRIGDIIDCWKVTHYETDCHLRLVAQMRLHGRAWLDFEVTEHEGGTLIRQTAIYEPRGLIGILYWYTVYPVHALMFSGMLQQIEKRSGGSSH